MRWETDVKLAEHTRYQIGGPTPKFGRPESRAALAVALRDAQPGMLRVLGWGANVLVSDVGVKEPVVVLGGEFAHMKSGDCWIEAGAAAGLPALVGEARRSSFEGWSFLEAVPGSVGGGLRMNAGSTDTGLWDRVAWVEAMTPAGETIQMTPAEAQPGYRTVAVSEAWIFIAARFESTPGDSADVERRHFDRRKMKVETQVYDLPSCGSTWKNPGAPWGSAWELVERVGMRGVRRGGAQITERHANFIANLGGARASDVWWLMAETRRRIQEEVGVNLEPEIRLWGFSPDELAALGGEG